MLSEVLMIRVLRQELELSRKAEQNLFFTYNWTESDGPRLYTEVLSDEEANMYKSKMMVVSHSNKDTLGPYKASTSIDFTKTTDEKGNLHFDFGNLVTTIPKSVYITLRERLLENKDIKFKTNLMKSDHILFHCLKDVYDYMPAITMEFRHRTKHSYKLTSKNYIVKVPRTGTKNKGNTDLCYLAIVPHEKEGEWIIGATFAKVVQTRMTSLDSNKVRIGFFKADST
ncbi:unnamed protein product [Albugo candida]|uniref:Peptidase A1 domain-containing protein n=1 Tax=Albugo candida TaxID=65357 RepID=A0A024FV49_9STRA|nr:unnamed protein product [Albugo candida]|eukprot:CCI11028.1 unnamed protein product [Albugo candida]